VFFYLYGNHGVNSKPYSKTFREIDNRCKIERLVKRVQLQLMNSVNCVADIVCVRTHLGGDYEIQRVVEL